jgi:hypothetical protein
MEEFSNIEHGEPPELAGFVNNSNKNIDKITLELLMNNQMYNKYLSKADPKKYEENQKFKDNLQRHKSRLIKMTENLINDPKKQINNEICETFLNYINACVKFIETKDLEEQTTKDSYSSDEEEMLFDEKHMNNTNHTDTAIDFPKSYWGQPVIKSKNAQINNDIRAFASKQYRR